MLKITPEKVSLNLKKNNYVCYVLYGIEVFYLEETKKKILNKAKKKGFCLLKIFYLKKEKDILKFLKIKTQNNLFFSKKIIILYIQYNIQKTIFNYLLKKIFNKLDKNLLLIIYYFQSKFHYLNNSQNFPCLFIECTIPNNNQLLIWLRKKILDIDLNIDPVAITMLCQYYEKNILGLSNAITILFLVFKKKKVTYKKVLKIISDSSKFLVYDWLFSLFNQELDKSIRILNHLVLKKNQILLLIKLLQKDISQLIYLKKTSTFYQQKKFLSFFEKLKNNFLKKKSIFFSLEKLHKILQYLISIEIIYKKSYEYIVIDKLKKIIILICCKKQ
ncbi:DNA polymerase III subunit delta [Buchnera aphidicola]|uniref:DNA polymerase III subunit delta n=1 Tax=Buchnera aphidicola (Anoecia oenotherae) TaxID=1241833 RepID=A0A4D6XZL6_9GAMM|nr:DNA polymerase III subunit delta [Buchnera aphidicola]QCI19460.1 DNA polymerase III subunit delta [Buchnera aphidicola (Anoecia oenotherae)]